MGFWHSLFRTFKAKPVKLSDEQRSTIRRKKLQRLGESMVDASDWAKDPKGYRIARKIDRDARKRNR